MVSAKELREVFDDIRDDAGKRASDAIRDAMRDTRLPRVTLRREEPPAVLWLAIGLALGALAGVALAALLTPIRGSEARQRIGEQVQQQVHRVRRAAETDGSPQYEPTSPTQA